MHWILYIIGWLLIKLVQLLPLPVVARIGRFLGALAYFIDARHRKVAIKNLQMCFSELTPQQVRSIAHENFRRIGENFLSAIKTASMPVEQLRDYVEIVGAEKMLNAASKTDHHNIVVAIGHFGNFELYAKFGQFYPQFKCATTYRSLRQEPLNRLLQSLRERSGCLYFERRTDAQKLRSAMQNSWLVLGLLADQHAGDNGLRLPFFGIECSTSAAPALFALRYKCPLLTAICYRIAPAKWRIEIGDEIPTYDNSTKRDIRDISLDINKAFEIAIKRDPANWFWVHNRWKKPPQKLNYTSIPDMQFENDNTSPKH